MKFDTGYKIILSIFVLVFAAANFACQSQAAQTPTEAYKSLYAAVKAKDAAKVKEMMSKNSLSFAEFAASKQNQTIEKTLENGFLETTFADSLPQMRDERVKGNFGAVEVYNEKQKRWDDTAFVLEDGAWKLAVGDQFKGSYQSPGKGQAQIENEANNPMNNPNLLPPAQANTNGNFPNMMPNADTNAANGKKQKVETAEVPTGENPAAKKEKK